MRGSSCWHAPKIGQSRKGSREGRKVKVSASCMVSIHVRIDTNTPPNVIINAYGFMDSLKYTLTNAEFRLDSPIGRLKMCPVQNESE